MAGPCRGDTPDCLWQPSSFDSASFEVQRSPRQRRTTRQQPGRPPGWGWESVPPDGPSRRLPYLRHADFLGSLGQQLGVPIRLWSLKREQAGAKLASERPRLFDLVSDVGGGSPSPSVGLPSLTGSCGRGPDWAQCHTTPVRGRRRCVTMMQGLGA